MGLFDSLLKGNDNYYDKLSEDEKAELDAKMDDLNLEEWQKDLVREGKYDLDNFEEEDLDEDDYYSEDDAYDIEENDEEDEEDF